MPRNEYLFLEIFAFHFYNADSMTKKIILIIGFLLLPLSTHAQSLASSIDHTRLQRLYELQLQGSRDASLPARVTAERSRIRGIVDDEVNDLINALSRSGTGSELNIAGAAAQQRVVVSALNTRREGLEVDLDLLNKEEEYYAGDRTATGAVLEGRLTSSKAEWMAKKAILEEARASLEFFRSLAQDRLDKFAWEQRLQQFSLLITIGRYFLIFLLIIAAERLVRMQFLTRIRGNNARYVVMKLFTAGVYSVTLVWLIAQISADYPGALTSFAILGAGVAFALQDVFKDIVGWFVIMQKRLFVPGNRVTIGSYTGDIVDINLLSTTLLEVNNAAAPDVSRTGQVLAIPNAQVLTQPVLNYSATSDYVDAELTLLFTYDSDLVSLEELLRALLTQETQQYMERARRQTAVRIKQFYTSHEPQGSRVFLEPEGAGIRVTMRFPVPLGERRIVITRLTKNILAALAKQPAMKLAVSPHEPYSL